MGGLGLGMGGRGLGVGPGPEWPEGSEWPGGSEPGRKQGRLTTPSHHTSLSDRGGLG
jgi:hypothetical protein